MTTIETPTETPTMHPSEPALLLDNPRRGHVAAIADILRAIGIMKPITVNRGTYTGRPNEVLAGNHTLKAIRNLAEQYPDDERWQSVPVHFVDVDEDRARRFVVADNRASELGETDPAALLDYVSVLPDLDGTGISADDMAELQALAAGSAPTLDDLLDEVGDPTDEDKLQSVSLKLDGHTKRLWEQYRKTYSDDDGALRSLLEKLG